LRSQGIDDHATMAIRIGIITVSDRASAGVYEDKGGPAILDTLKAYLGTAWEPVARVIPDDLRTIAGTIAELADKQGCCLVVTTGGTGPSPRDVTPEATELACHRLLPGFGEQMRAVSLAFVPTAILSRQTAGIRGRCLVLNLPGKPSAIRQCLDAVFPAVPHCIDQIGGPRLETDPAVLTAFRPKEK
jgi:molybdopterin adenylyltransferase